MRSPERTIFATVEVAYFMVFVCFSQRPDEFLDVRRSEGRLFRDVVAFFELVVGAVVRFSVCESSPRIAKVIEVQTGLVDNADTPHEAVIHATAKALTASHFQCLRAFAFIEGKSTGGIVFESFQGCVAGHLEPVAATLVCAVVFRVYAGVPAEVFAR